MIFNQWSVNETFLIDHKRYLKTIGAPPQFWLDLITFDLLSHSLLKL